MVTINCPGELAYGKNEKYSNFGHEKIPANSDLTFEVDILGCEEQLEVLEKSMKAKKVALPVVHRVADHFIDTKFDDQVDTKQSDTKVIEIAEKEVKQMKKEVKKAEKKLEKEEEEEAKEEEKAKEEDVDVDKMVKKEEKLVVEQ